MLPPVIVAVPPLSNVSPVKLYVDVTLAQAMEQKEKTNRQTTSGMKKMPTVFFIMKMPSLQ